MCTTVSDIIGLICKNQIQDDDWDNIWIGSEIICLNPCVVVKESICVSCKVVMSSDHHAGNLALRSPKTTVNWDFEQSNLLTNSSKPDKKDSISKVLWLGDLYTTATYPFFFGIVTSQTWWSHKLCYCSCMFFVYKTSTFYTSTSTFSNFYISKDRKILYPTPQAHARP